jgi:hypothetical protein
MPYFPIKGGYPAFDGYYDRLYIEIKGKLDF